MLSLLIGTALSFNQPSPLPAKNQSEVAVARRKAYLREMAQQLKLPDISSRKGYVIRLTTLPPRSGGSVLELHGNPADRSASLTEYRFSETAIEPELTKYKYRLEQMRRMPQCFADVVEAWRFYAMPSSIPEGAWPSSRRNYNAMSCEEGPYFLIEYYSDAAKVNQSFTNYCETREPVAEVGAYMLESFESQLRNHCAKTSC